MKLFVNCFIGFLFCLFVGFVVVVFVCFFFLGGGGECLFVFLSDFSFFLCDTERRKRKHNV